MNIYTISHACASTIVKVDESDNVLFDDMQADAIESGAPPNCKLHSADERVTNFVYFNDTVLVYDDVAAKVMDEFVEYAGELFPLEVDGLGKCTLLNVLEVCNPVNKQASRVFTGNWRKTLASGNLIFHRGRVASLSSLFKIPELAYRPILLVQGAANDRYTQDHDFYHLYHDAGLTGLKFDLVWTDES